MTASLFAALCLSACQPEEQPLRYGGQLYAEEFLLQGIDFWSPYGLNIEHVLFKNPDDLLQAFLNDVVDIALFSDIQAAQVFDAMGEDALIIGVSEQGDRISTLTRSASGISGWDDLAGKKVALRSNSGAELAMERYFSRHIDLDWDAIEWVNLPVEDMPAALNNGAVDAITAVEPIPVIAQANGALQVMQSYGDCCPAPLVLVTTRKFARRNSDDLIAFLQAHLDKSALIKDDTPLCASTASRQAETYGLDISPLAFHILFKRVDFDLQINNTVLSALEDTAQSLVAAGVLVEVPQFFSDSTFYEDAILKNSE
jgi:ABC-type nitrate/sulfonate/bicarbonate transport system substrate-binding protein